ncbi:Malate synthase G [Diplonema papillatum]|nr:Malate synthase G [Diplonema papillatum]
MKAPSLVLMRQVRFCHIARGKGLLVHKDVVTVVENDVLPGTNVEPDAFWKGLQRLQDELLPRNNALLEKRDELQKQIDAYHLENKGKEWDAAGYAKFLTKLGYLTKVPKQGAVQVRTTKVDPEVAILNGPQLVCPVNNARYVINAGNARWGSLLDALYGTDVIPGEIPSGGFNKERGAKVFAKMNEILDEILPLKAGSWGTTTRLSFDQASKKFTPALKDPKAFIGFATGRNEAFLFKHNGLHIEVLVNKEHPIGQMHTAGIFEVNLEAALSTIADAEDSACAVDAEDKALVYQNWNGLMKRTLSVDMGDGKQRLLAAEKRFTSAKTGKEIRLAGGAVLFCRNVGPHMYTDIVKLADCPDSLTPEHFLDAMVTVAAGIHDVSKTEEPSNSRTKSIYIVKPKMHGPDEVQLVVEMFGIVEKALGLKKNTVKIGIMDEERRTSVNLLQCIEHAKDRVFFINTGFLDRTGDEIHTSMQAGPVVEKDAVKGTAWIQTYEVANVDAGLATGLETKGQIGKGMWAAPDNMAAMMATKAGHLKAGASTAWVPSPTAATLHALHYHQISCGSVQQALKSKVKHLTAHRKQLLEPPLLTDAERKALTPERIQRELDRNIQSLLGYVWPWVANGIGCSKVPDIDGVALMEDRATLRISSQHVTNWLLHGIVTEQQVKDTLVRMAKLVDDQNAPHSDVPPMTADLSCPEFKAASDLIFDGLKSPNGYTEDILSRYRRARKSILKAQSA